MKFNLIRMNYETSYFTILKTTQTRLNSFTIEIINPINNFRRWFINVLPTKLTWRSRQIKNLLNRHSLFHGTSNGIDLMCLSYINSIKIPDHKSNPAIEQDKNNSF